MSGLTMQPAGKVSIGGRCSRPITLLLFLNTSLMFFPHLFIVLSTKDTMVKTVLSFRSA